MTSHYQILDKRTISDKIIKEFFFKLEDVSQSSRFRKTSLIT